METFNRTATTSERLKEALSLRNMRQTDLAKATGIDKGSISCYVSGRYEPKNEAICKMAQALSVSEMWLWGCGDAMKEETMKANELFAAEMYRIGDKEHYKGDRKLFVKNLGELLSQTDQQVLSAELDDNEIVTIHFEGGDKKVNVAMDSYTAIIKDVLKVL